ncbi:MAG: HAD hydrolase family protein [Planctomycetota bacterium]|nr:HAD hydrolase family protein [Planctomycetota bacterium]
MNNQVGEVAYSGNLCECGVPETWNENNTMFRLFIFDFDGTALGGHEPYDQFPEPFARFLDNLQEVGASWATCTTWHPAGQERVFRNSHLSSRPVRAIGRTGLACGLYTGETLVIDAEWDVRFLDMHARYAEQDLPRVRETLSSFDSVLSVKEGFDYILSLRLTSGVSFREEMSAHPELEKATYIQAATGAESAQVFGAHMSKALAVEELQKLVNVNPCQTVIAGDGLNDLPMLTPDLAGGLVCPSNAVEEVKQQAVSSGGIVSDLPFSEGVMDALQQLGAFRAANA